MSIDLDVEMILPIQSESSIPFFKDVSVIVNHFVKNGVVLKRVEALGKEAIVFNGMGNEIINKFKTEFNILNAFFITFTPKTPENYLCLIGDDQIDFYSQDENYEMCCPIALPFKICRAHLCSFGIILERSSFPGEHGNPPGAAQLFSLTHPYNEIMPILCKFKGDADCHYTFRSKRMAVVSKDIAANWDSSFSGPIDLLMCYDFDERTNNIFLIRKCTKEERLAAKNDLGVLNSSALMHTPSTIRSFYSPNFFNRRFAENRLATICLLNPQKNCTDIHLHQSPASCFNNILFANSNGSSHVHHLSQTSATSSMPNTAPSKTPITRRITRSMAAAAATGEYSNPSFSIGGISSLPSSTADKSISFHRSLEHNAALNRMRLKQKLSLAAGNNAAATAYNNSTPRHGQSFSIVDMDELLSFGGRETDDEPPSSLNMAVEFCLDWIWSEPIPPPIDAIDLRSGSTSSVVTEKVAQKLETLRVSSSTSLQSDEVTNKKNLNRIASTFFITRQALSPSERCIVFHISSDRRVMVLNIHFPKALEDSSSILVPDPIITENGSLSSFIRGDAVVPLLHAPFFLVLLNFSFTDSPSACSIALYTGCTKIANIALNIGIPHIITGNRCSTLLKLLPGGLYANGYNNYEIRTFVENEDHSQVHPVDDVFRTNLMLFSYKFQLGFSTRLSSRCLLVFCDWIGATRQLQFLSRLFCSNPWKVVKEAQKIPFLDEIPTECIEMALLFEQIFEEFCYDQKDIPFQKLLTRIRSNEEDGEERESKRTRQNTQSIEDILNNDKYWLMLKADRQIALDALSLMDNLKGVKYINERLLERIRRIIRFSNRPRFTNFSFDEKMKRKENMLKDAHKWISAPVWTSDLRLYNVQQMLDSSQPILIPSKDLGQTPNEVQQREQHEQFLLSVAIRTVARPFGKAALNFRTRHAFEEQEGEIKLKQNDEKGNKNNLSDYPQIGIRSICLNGRVHPGWHQVDFPLNDTNPSHKLAMDWANFYNALAYGFSYCGGFPLRFFSSINKEEGNSEGYFSTTVRAGLLLAAGLTGSLVNLNLYDIHALLTQNDKHLVIALLIGCAAAHRGTSEVHVYKMISTHLPFLLQPTLIEFKIELSVQTAAIISLGLLFAETANHSVSSLLLNQISLEVPCESDQAFERYSFVLTAGMAIGLINLGKGKEIIDTEIPISTTPSLEERLIKLLNGGERRLAYLSYDRVECPGMRIGNFSNSGSGGSNLLYSLRRYTPGGSTMDGIGNVNGMGNNGGNAPSANQQQHQNSSTSHDYSGIGQPMSNHVRELPNLNIHLTSPAAAIALGLMYLRTRDEWIYDALSVKDSFYEIDKIRPDMLMIRTFCRCLVKFDDIQPTKQWIEKQIPEIVRRYSQHFVEAQTAEDIWWEEFINVETISKVHFYCTAGALLALSLRFASSCQKDALSLIHQLYERISINNNQKKVEEQLSWSGFASRAGRNCLHACTNICALAMGLLMAGSGDLQTTRLLRKIRNILPMFEDGGDIKNKSANCMPPKDSSVHSLHVSTNMALGFLYFGYGRYRLSDSNLAIASLVLSLFPLFPHSITDNRFYFQPLRFLWILAAEKNSKPKCLRKLSKSRKIRKILKRGEVEIEGETDQEINVDCPRCGRIEITKNERFSLL